MKNTKVNVYKAIVYGIMWSIWIGAVIYAISNN